ncbi:MAG: InlB B-repeat-containing protein [Thermoplasmata archaeon]
MSANPHRSSSVGRPAPTLLLAIVIVATLTLSALVPLGAFQGGGAPALAGGSAAPSASSSSPSPAIAAAALPTSPAMPAPTPSASPATSSGPGTFYTNTPIPFAPAANDSCVYSGWAPCFNNTGSPSIVSTPSGVIASAYTAFTNVSACPQSSNWTISNIGIVVSTNGGANYGAPSYLNNPGCSDPSNFTSAMTPSIAALADGTLVLSYIEYNISQSGCANWYYFPALSACYVSADRLVVMESSDNGTTWGAPTVVNTSYNPSFNATSWMPAQPTLATFGNTIYLAWTNFTWVTFASTAEAPSVGLNMVVSADGGSTWGAPISLPVEVGDYFAVPSWMAYSPALAVAANGTLYVAYSTNLTGTSQICVGSTCVYIYPDATMDVVVARSVDNGTTFALSTVASAVPVMDNGVTWTRGGGYEDSLWAPQPAITTDPLSGNVYVAYAGAAIGTICYSPTDCALTESFENVYAASSTTGGESWSAPVALGDSWLGLHGSANNSRYLFTPSIGVANGTVYVNALTEDDTVCSYQFGYGYPCGERSDLVFASYDNGSTFTAGVPPYPIAPIYDYPLWDGVYSSMTIYNGQPFIAWTAPACWTPGGCDGSGGSTQVVISTPFEGLGVSVTFVESGLPLSTVWSASVSGNVRSGSAGTALSVSGVPIGSTEVWVVPWVNVSYGVAYLPTLNLSSPGNFTGNTTILVTFDEYVLLNVVTVPPPSSTYNPFYCGGSAAGYGDYCTNMQVTPNPGTTWQPYGSPISYSILDGGLPSTCYFCTNLSFASWTGSGLGSWNTTAPNGTAVLYGPVNESANFNVLGTCYGSGFGSCTPALYEYNFTEVGLPVNTTWSVTLNGSVNSSAGSANSSALPYLTFAAPEGPLPFTIWSVPYNATYSYVGTASYPSPVGAFQGGREMVTFSLEANAGSPFVVQIAATGIPSGTTSWGLNTNSGQFGIASATSPLLTFAGGTISLNASPIYTPSGTGALISSFTVHPQIVGGANFTVSPGASFTLAGPAVISANYLPQYWISVSTAGAGGSIVQPSQWVAAGGSSNYTAVAATGYAFAGWSGTGSGSVSSLAPTITVSPNAPVTEVASFVRVIPTWTVNVTAAGLPSGQPFTVGVGNLSYSGSVAFAVGGLLSGNYSVSAPTVVPNGTVGVRYVVSSITSTLPYSAGSLIVESNGTLTVHYAVEYTLTISTGPDGSVSPAAGTSWQESGATVSLTATPSTGYLSTGWVGTGIDSVTSSAPSITLNLSGPITESASFVLRPTIPPQTYNVTVAPTGLPAGLQWSVSTGAMGVQGSGALVLSGLNGTYVLAVPTVTPALGIRYVPSNSGSFTVDATSNMSVNVTFTEQFFVTVSSSIGGTVGPASAWVNSGTSIALTALANSTGYVFSNWTGSGPGAYTGTVENRTITPTGAVSEIAAFSPLAGGSSSASSIPTWVPIAALVALVVVGFFVGMLLVRGRGGGSTPSTGKVASPGASARPAKTAAPEEEGEAPASEGESDVYVFGKKGGSS